MPVRRVRRGRVTQWEISPGGLVSALRPVLRNTQTTWVGWTGTTKETLAPFAFDGIQSWPVPLSSAEAKAYYEGFSNRILWPLYHDAIRAPEYRQSWWQPYVDVNQRFAMTAAQAVAPGGLVWVHDYHLQLAPAMLRSIEPDSRIGFFLHVPFPPQELFAQLPWRREILQGLLGADVIGFQTAVGANNFLQVAGRFADAEVDGQTVSFDGRTAQVGAYPISIDVEQFECLAADSEVRRRSAHLRARLGNARKLMLGVDRLDYTKGIDIRLRAFLELLRSGRIARDECVFVQVAEPSREHLKEYKELRVVVERLVGEINGEFGDLGRAPVQYLHRGVSTRELVALYLAADVMLVTPLRDGMNLVSKEYVASRTDETGVLVLSEFTGAAKELTSALLVNPHDIGALTCAMQRALTMPPAEERQRMQSLRSVVKGNDIHHWANSFLQDLAPVRA